jgi:hypothetical protein
MDQVLDGAMDRCTFMRDAYLQHRNAQVGRDQSDGKDEPPGEVASSVDAVSIEMYALPFPGTPESLSALIDRDSARRGQLIKAAGIVPE